jgi:hypothetical protein
MIAARMAGLIAGRKGIMDIALDPKGLSSDGMHDRMAIAAKLSILELEPVD